MSKGPSELSTCTEVDILSGLPGRVCRVTNKKNVEGGRI